MVALLLGKLHISPGSSEDRLREAYTEVRCAVDDGLLTDTTSRNALYKIHVSLGKVVNALDENQPASLRASTRSASVVTDRQHTEERTIVGEPDIPEEGEDEQTAMLKEQDSIMDDGVTEGGDVTQQSSL